MPNLNLFRPNMSAEERAACIVDRFIAFSGVGGLRAKHRRSALIARVRANMVAQQSAAMECDAEKDG